MFISNDVIKYKLVSMNTLGANDSPSRKRNFDHEKLLRHRPKFEIISFKVETCKTKIF